MKKYLTGLLSVLFMFGSVFAVFHTANRSNLDMIAKRFLFTSDGTASGSSIMDINTGGNVIVYGLLKDGSGNLYATGAGPSGYVETDPIWNSDSGNFIKLGNIYSYTGGGFTINSYSVSGVVTTKAGIASWAVGGLYNTIYGIQAGVQPSSATKAVAGYFWDLPNPKEFISNSSAIYAIRGFDNTYSGSSQPLVMINDFSSGPGDLLNVYRYGNKFRIDSTGDTYVYGNLYDGSGVNYITGYTETDPVFAADSGLFCRLTGNENIFGIKYFQTAIDVSGYASYNNTGNMGIQPTDFTSKWYVDNQGFVTGLDLSNITIPISVSGSITSNDSIVLTGGFAPFRFAYSGDSVEGQFFTGGVRVTATIFTP